MAKSKSNILKTITDVFLSSTLSNVKDGAEDLMDKAQKKALILQERLVHRLTTVATLLLSCLFLLGALMFFLIQDVGLRNSQAFGLVGLVLLALTFYFKFRTLQAQLDA